MALKFPKFSGVRLPAGAIRQNLPLLAGAGLSTVLVTAIMLTGEDPPPPPDPLTASRPQPAVPDSLGDPLAVDSVGRQVDDAIRDLTADQEAQRLAILRAEQQAARERQREQQRLRAELADAQRTLEALRRAPAVAPSTFEPQAPIVSEDEAALREALRLEALEREARAPRAAMVVSSARGLSDRTHRLPAGPAVAPGSVSGAQPSVFPPGTPTAPAAPGGAPPAAPRPAPLPPPPAQGAVPVYDPDRVAPDDAFQGGCRAVPGFRGGWWCSRVRFSRAGRCCAPRGRHPRRGAAGRPGGQRRVRRSARRTESVAPRRGGVSGRRRRRPRLRGVAAQHRPSDPAERRVLRSGPGARQPALLLPRPAGAC